MPSGPSCPAVCATEVVDTRGHHAGSCLLADDSGPPITEREDGSAIKSLATPIGWRGILAIVVGIIAIAWPGITIWAFVILFSVYAFPAAGMEATQAFASRTVGPVAGASGPGAALCCRWSDRSCLARDRRAGTHAAGCGVGVRDRVLRAAPCLRRTDGAPLGEYSDRGRFRLPPPTLRSSYS